MLTGIALTGYLIFRPSPASVPAAEGMVPRHQPSAVVDVRGRGVVEFFGTDSHAKARVSVEIVDEDRSRALGLMYRRSLGSDHGMLFVFDSSSIQSFWMKNTVLSLDMIFVNEQGRVVTIHRNTRPYSEQTYVSTEPARYVVEVNAGYADAHGLRDGDRMEWTRERVRTRR